MEFIDYFQKGADRAIKSKRKFIQRLSRARLPRVGTYFDFSYPTEISTGAAVVLAAEYERVRRFANETPFTVDLDRWNEGVFRKLFQLGFFEIVGITPQRQDVLIEDGDTRTMQIVSMQNADDLERVDRALQALGRFLNPASSIPENVIIELLTGLSEAISNVTNHAYPSDYEPEYPHIGRLWISATADRNNQSLTVVIYDQGVTIPVTYPRIARIEKVENYLGRALKQRRAFEFQNDGTYIRAAMKYGGSRTDHDYRGKGLPQMIEVIDRLGRGKMTVISRGGWCYRDARGRLRSGAVPFSIGGTLVEWELELSSNEMVD
jgi:anti-sigma regulatory factor (Ser/Thr protein kinase)